MHRLKNSIQSFNRIQFDEGAKGFLLLLLFGQLFLTNGIYLFFGALTFGIVLYRLQQPIKPSIFTLIYIYQFIQVSASIWLSNYIGKDVNYRSNHGSEAIVFSYIGLVVLFIPVCYYQDKLPTISLQQLKLHASRLSAKKCFQAYLIAFFIANALGGVAYAIAGLTQFIYTLMNVKWMLFCLFGMVSILNGKMKKFFYLVTAIEFGLGFFSYFSDFKTVLFYLAIIALIFIVRVQLKHVIIVVIGIILIAFLAIKWSEIKGEYRKFLNQGTGKQVIGVSRGDAFNKLIELSTSDIELVDDPAIGFLDRLQYTYHLAKTMDRVPSVIPHQNGANWGSTLEFVFTPRALNPDKPIFQATVKTIKYTGISYAGYNQGVSFSLGYFGDCYIDFGYYGMFIPILLIGLIWGSTYYYFLRRSSNNFVFNYSIVGAIYIEMHAFEMDSTLLTGRLFTGLIIFFLLKIFFFNWLFKNLKEPSVTLNQSN